MTSPFAPREVQALSAALPPQGANPIGHLTRHVVLMHTKRSTPGGTPGRNTKWYRDIFFPNIGVSPYEGEVARLTGLDLNYFRNLSTALLCQRMYEVTTKLRPALRADVIGSDLATFTGQLRQSSYRFYTYMAGHTDSPIKTALAAFPDEPSRMAAKQHYLAGLTSASWVSAKLIEDKDGDWRDRDWELYHHWIKLTALGASAAEIDDAIAKVIAMQLPVPPALGPGVWMKQAIWLERDFGGDDAADATEGILKEICSNSGRSVLCNSEVYSFQFTAERSGGPGYRYRDQAAGSCFAPGTRVVMADGRLRPIEDIVAGDQVQTPAGPREVLLRSAPLRGGRTLLRFSGTRFAFTPSHPFLVAPLDPASAGYAAADPDALARNVPTLSQFGLTALNAPAVLLRHTAGGDVPFVAPAIHTAPDLKPDLIYDLYLDVGPDGRSEYYAGDDDVQLLVSSEVPRFAAAPEATAVMLHVLRQAGPGVLQVLKDEPDNSFEGLLCVGLDCLSTTMMSVIGPQLQPGHGDAAPAALRGADSAAELAASVRDFASSMTAMPDDERRRMGIAVEQFAARFGPQFMAVLAMPWRTFDLAAEDVANMLAITPYSIELFRPGPPVGEAQIEVSLKRGHSRSTRRLQAKPGAPADRWYYGVDAPAYFPEWAPPGPAIVWHPTAEAAGREEDMLWQVEIALQGDEGCRMVIPLAREIAHGYQEFRAPLIGLRGETVGQALFDVRLLTLEAYVAEIEARDAAREGTDLTPLADRLARLAAEFVETNFAEAVATFKDCAATIRTR